MSCELILVSASAARGEPANCDLTFRLDVSRLPKFSVTDIWQKKDGNPLRDRLMIEWLFSHSVAQEMLQDMDTKITRQIHSKLLATKTTLTRKDECPPLHTTALEGAVATEEQPPSTVESPNERPTLLVGRPRVLVGILCPNGAHYSPCFVERLYERFQRDRTLNKQLFVEIHHWDIISHDSRKRGKYQWYRTRIPRKYIQYIEMLTSNRLWIPFDENMNQYLEETFQEDRYYSVAPNGSCSIDFSTGTLFDTRKRSDFYIRSAVLPPKKARFHVNSRFVGNEAYKAAASRYDSAGILFYSVHPDTGEALFLLGHMTYGTLSWCDFGGLKSWKRLRERPRHTAARECYEETLGILGSAKILQEKLEDYKTNNVFKVVNEIYNYVSHFLRVPYKNYPEEFDVAALSHGIGLEIDEIKWFTVSAMREAVQMVYKNESTMTVSHLTEDGGQSPKTSQLRVEFVRTLCIAEKLGILDSIEYIAKQLYLSSRPPPPRPVSYPKPHPLKSKANPTPQAVVSSAAMCVEREVGTAVSEDGGSVGQRESNKLEENHIPSYTETGPGVISSNTEAGPGAVPANTEAGPGAVPANTETGPGAIPSNTETSPGVISSSTEAGPGAVPSNTETGPGAIPSNTDIPSSANSATPTDPLSGPISDEVCRLSEESTPPSSDCASSEDTSPNKETELEDLVSRSRAWSFEEFVSGLPPEKIGVKPSEDEVSHSKSSLLKGLKQWKGKAADRKGGKKKKKSNATPTVNGRTVLYYGMGAGNFRSNFLFP